MTSHIILLSLCHKLVAYFPTLLPSPLPAAGIEKYFMDGSLRNFFTDEQNNRPILVFIWIRKFTDEIFSPDQQHNRPISQKIHG
jgi:hypothetical protein